MKLGRQPTKLVVSGVAYNGPAVKLDSDHVLRLLRSRGVNVLRIKITGHSPNRLVKC
jgi:hypothetical protein